MKKFGIAVLLLSQLTASVWALETIEDKTTLSHLPQGLTFSAGKLSLVADYAHHVTGTPIPVYLINDSSRTLTLSTQDGDPSLKLERQDAFGIWQRAQIHYYSFCGNSYFQRALGAGHFFEFQGYQPGRGQEQKIRFAFYDQQDIDMASNEGMGLANENDVRAASVDDMTLQKSDVEFLRRVALWEDMPEEAQIVEEFRIPELKLRKNAFVSERQAKALRILHDNRKGDRAQETVREAFEKFPELKEYCSWTQRGY